MDHKSQSVSLDNHGNKTASPCIRNCCLDNKDICLGCFRHLDEIVAWNSYEEHQKQAVLTDCQQRRVQMTNTIDLNRL